MAEPPSLDGAVQERLIVLVPLAVAVRPVGAPGTVAAVVELLVTAKSVKLATSFPAASSSASAPATVLS